MSDTTLAITPSLMPASLKTASPAAGLELAHTIASGLMSRAATPADMPAMLRTQAAQTPSVELLSAVCFVAIAAANQGW